MVSTRKSEQPEAHRRILEVVKRIPRGHVCSYGEVARLAGLPRRARLVGTVLRSADSKVPWHRVVNAQGAIALPAGSEAYRRQRRLLERERVRFNGERIDLERHRWPQRESLDELLWDLRKR